MKISPKPRTMKSQGKTPIPVADAYKPCFYFADKSYYYLNVKATATPPNTAQTGSVLWPKPSSTDCLHPQHRAPGSGSPLALKQCSCNFSQPLFSTLCFRFTEKRSRNVKAVPRQQPHVCSTKLRVLHTKARCEGNSGLHKGPQPFQTYTTTLKTKAGNGRAALFMLPLGNRLRHAPSVTAHGNRLIWGWSAAKADLGTAPARHRGQAKGCTPLPALSCTDTASQEQGLGCTESQSTPTVLCTTNTKMLYITIKQLLYVLNAKHKYSDLGILITVLYFNMTRFLRFTHNSAYPWV